MRLMNYLKRLVEKQKEVDGVNFGSFYKVVTKTGGINRHRRRETAADARRVGRGEARCKASNRKQIKRAKRKAQKKARRTNRYV